MIAHAILAACAGIALAVSFPAPGFSLLSWFACAPLIIISCRSKHLHALVHGFIFGEAFFITLLYWIYNVLTVHTTIGIFLSIVIQVLLTSYLALYPSAFAFLLSVSARRYGTVSIFLSPPLWVALEFLRNFALSGFPWGLIGYAHASNPPLIQLASVTGVYGVSFVVVLINASIAFFFSEGIRLKRMIPLIISILFVAVLALWGSWRISLPFQEGKNIRVACIQGNFSGDVNENTDEEGILNDYLRLTVKAAREGATFIVWPETTTSFEVCCMKEYADLLKNLCRKLNIDLILGSLDREEVRNGSTCYYNSAFHLGADGRIADRYAKIHLVPYGEYVPLPKILIFVKKFVEAAGDFTKGRHYTIMKYEGESFSVLICYEVIFPEMVRRFVRDGSDFFVNITNDGWFGRSSAPYQHFDFLKMRAVESGRYFIRCAGTGISGIVSPYGRVMKQSGIFTEEIIVGDISAVHRMTIYSITGDLFATGCVIMSCILLLLLFLRRSKHPAFKNEAEIEI